MAVCSMTGDIPAGKGGKPFKTDEAIQKCNCFSDYNRKAAGCWLRQKRPERCVPGAFAISIINY